MSEHIDEVPFNPRHVLYAFKDKVRSYPNISRGVCAAVTVLGFVLLVYGASTGSTTDGTFISGIILFVLGLLYSLYVWRLIQSERRRQRKGMSPLVSKVISDEAKELFDMNSLGKKRGLPKGLLIFENQSHNNRCVQIILLNGSRNLYDEEYELYATNSKLIATVRREIQGITPHHQQAFRVIERFDYTLDQYLVTYPTDQFIVQKLNTFLEQLHKAQLNYNCLKLSDIVCLINGGNVQLKILDFGFMSDIIPRRDDTLLLDIQQLNIDNGMKVALTNGVRGIEDKKKD